MGSTLSFMDILIVLSGVYLVAVSVQMKRTGEVASALVNKSYDLKKAKDPKGYIDHMYKISVIMGAFVTASGVINYLNDAFWNVPNLGIIIYGIFMVLIIIYGKISVDAQKKYLSPE